MFLRSHNGTNNGRNAAYEFPYNLYCFARHPTTTRLTDKRDLITRGRRAYTRIEADIWAIRTGAGLLADMAEECGVAASTSPDAQREAPCERPTLASDDGEVRRVTESPGNAVRREPTKTPLDEYEAAKRLGVAVKTLRDWRMRGVGPRFAKFGRAVRYLSDDLEEYIRACMVETKGR